MFNYSGARRSIDVRRAGRMILRSVTSNAFIRESLLKLSRAGLLPDMIWKRLPVQTAFCVTLLDGNSFVYSSTPNDGIGRVLFWNGLEAWESETVRVFYMLAKRSNVVLDIGANTGIFTLIACAANTTTKVVSFEPVERIRKRLVENIRLNGWEHRCQVRAEAVSDENGFAKFHIPAEELPTMASLHEEGFRGSQGVVTDVVLVSIDTIFAPEEQIDLVKIDVEGFEDKVLQGMQRVLASSRPTIIVECNPDGPYKEVEAVLVGYGYNFFHLREEGPVAVHSIVPDVTGEYRNFLCSVEQDLALHTV